MKNIHSDILQNIRVNIPTPIRTIPLTTDIRL